MFIAGSRLPSQWLGWTMESQAQAFEEGNPLDRTIFSLLILLAVGILISRSFNWGGFVSRNITLLMFLCFALASVLWSDFPFVALKRWFRDLGNYFVILIVLTDPNPLQAVRTLFRRLSYLLIPLCILLDKYFPKISRVFDSWTGVGMYVGATTGKNLLGLVALLSGLFFFWDAVTRWPDRKERRSKRIIRVNVAFLAMSLWVLNTANSATCQVCMVLGCLIIAWAHGRFFRRHPTLFKVLIPGTFCLYLILSLGLGMSGNLAAAVGKDPTLTDRTKIWAFVLSMHTNPLLGTGYESFWLGPRLEWIWQEAGLGGLTEAHNGYLEVFLNLGIIGLLLLSGFLLASYKNICGQLKTCPNLGSLNVALWAIMLFYNVTEAGFRSSGLIWLVFLLGGIALPSRSRDRVSTTRSHSPRRDPFAASTIETANRWNS
jgi:O-antigen ligase